MTTVTIAHLITGLDTGGAEMMLDKLLSRMDPSKFRNIVISMTGYGKLGTSLQQKGIQVYSLNMRLGIPSPFGLWRVLKILRRECPDILQTWLYHADLLGTIAGKLVGIRRIAWNVRCSDMNLGHYSRLTGLVLRLLARMSRTPDAVVVNSEAGKRQHENIGYEPKNWVLIPNGFDTERFRPDGLARDRLSRQLGLPAESLIIGTVARYDPMKDHRNLLEALRVVLETSSAVRCVLAGKGVDNTNPVLVSAIKSLGLEGKVHLLGERRDIELIMPALDVFVLPSAFGEGFPNVVGEAMSCAVPCIVTDVGDSRFVVGDTGLVVPPMDSQALASAIVQFFGKTGLARIHLGAMARARIEEKFGLMRIVARYEDFYRGLAAQDPDLHVADIK